MVAFSVSFAQVTEDDYKRAEQYMPFNIYQLVKNLNCKPHWINDAESFWFKTQTKAGWQYNLYNAKNGKTQEAFKHDKLAEALQDVFNKKIHADSLKLKDLEFDKKVNTATFGFDTLRFSYSIKKNKLQKVDKSEKEYKKNESASPDGKWVAFVKDYNLYIRNAETKEEVQLTTDGIEKYDYATSPSWYKIVDITVGDTYDPSIYVMWAPNSQKFVATRLDRRKAKDLYMYQYDPKEGMRAKVWGYERALPGEPLPTLEYFIFDVDTKESLKVDMEPVEDIWAGLGAGWTEDGSKFYIPIMKRYYKALDLIFVDPASGKKRTVVHEEAKTMIEYQMVGCEFVDNGEKLLWLSERDGWNHIYMYDTKSGSKPVQITKGRYVVRSIEYVDEANQEIYFIAGGKEPNRDPYFRYLYKTNFEGKDPILLTPEDADHGISFSPCKKYFVDNFSRVDLKPKAVLRSTSDGKKIGLLQEADISELEATGWRHPVRFTTIARDGKTRLYGVLQYPNVFDSTKMYPIIDNSYSGPQAVNTPKTFSRGIWNDFLPLAQAGFITMRFDGLGTAMRSKAFHDVSYKNLGDIGAPDHIAAIKQLAEKHSYIDTSRVGIYGHSAGGYDAARALLAHPEFYKVGVAAAGNHDHRMAKAWWPEQYMGEPGPHYEEKSNLTAAKNLQGKLLLAHGAMDNNVNPACTYRLTAELIKHNKDFEVLITPNDDHGQLWHNKYFIRKRMDFFVKNLLHVEPPKEFEFKEYKSK